MNEVKRALMFWPAFASALIILISLITPTTENSLGEFSRQALAKLRGVTAGPPPTELAEVDASQLNRTFLAPEKRIESSEAIREGFTLERQNNLVASNDFPPVIEDQVTYVPPVSEQPEAVGPAEMDLAEMLSTYGQEPMESAPPTVPEALPDLEAVKNTPMPFVVTPPMSAPDSSKTSDLEELLQKEPVDFSPEDLLRPRVVNQETAEELSAEPMAQATPSTIAGDLGLEKRIDSELDNLPEPIADDPMLPTPATPSLVKSSDSIVADQPEIKPDVIAFATPPSVMPRSIAHLAKPEVELPRSVDVAAEPAFDQLVPSITTNVARTEPAPINVDAAKKATEQAVKRTVRGDSVAWPATTELESQLAELADSMHEVGATKAASSSTRQSIQQWTQDVSDRLNQMRTLPRLGDPKAGQLINELHQLSYHAYKNAENLSSREHQIAWLVAAYSVDRRIAIWRPVYRIASGSTGWVSDNENDRVGESQINELIKNVRNDAAVTGDAAGWDKFLQLSNLSSVVATENSEARALAAQRFLSRLEWHGLTEDSRTWLQRESVKQLAKAITPWAQNPVDYASLLSQIERQEADSIDLAAVDIAGAAQSLRFAQNPEAKRVAQAIDTHYRNANIRMALNEKLIQRLIPDIQPTTVPVRTKMLGSRVRGVSQVRSDLMMRLQPSNDRWNFVMHTHGNVNTQSVGLNGKTTISTRGNAVFAADTPIQITPQGIQIADSVIDVRGRTRLRGVRTSYDSWPLFGSLFGSIAAAKYQEISGVTSRIANRRVHDQLSAEIDQRLEKRVGEASAAMTEMVLGPLSSLQLSPRVVDMKTTDKRLIARYRLAGDRQIGAFTPRPRAPSDSLISLQVNQSALNNTLERVVPSNRPTTIHDAVNHTMQIFGRDPTTMPSDIPDDVVIQFTKTRPITVEIDNNTVWITMRVVELSRAKGPKLRRFIVRAAYVPEVEGLNARLVRDGHLRISGPGMSMRERLPVRAIFNKVLSPNRSISLTAPALVQHTALQGSQISQLELRDGWLAMAISDQRETVSPVPAAKARIATGPVNKQ